MPRGKKVYRMGGRHWGRKEIGKTNRQTERREDKNYHPQIGHSSLYVDHLVITETVHLPAIH